MFLPISVNPLEMYHEKRDFHRTPEPSAEEHASGRDAPIFVVQKHAASRLHYDFRLEWDGVLLSWAVPKGPVPDPDVKRLAMRTEDHPLSYAEFEGMIPEGEYGGGTVMVWDRGRWTADGDPGRGLRDGKLDFHLAGQKLTGRWTLVRTGDEGGRERWLLFKREDEHARPGSAGALLEERDRSVVTGRTLEEIAEDRKTTPPARISPQLAKLGKSAPVGDGWLHEIKFDGYRLLCHVGSDGEGGGVDHAATPRVRLVTRNGKDWTDRFGRIARAAATLDVETAILDGEAVVLDDTGRSDFQALQNALGGGGGDLIYFAFDLLHLNGHDLTRSPIETRKELLEGLLETAPGVIRYSDHVVGRGAAFHEQACRMGLEGIISKRAGSRYSSGRGSAWRKTKCLRRQELAVVGWTDPEGSRVGFGSLVLGVNDDEGKLVYAGRVGTGFTDADLARLSALLAPLERKTPPVTGAPRTARGRKIHWARPELVAEIEFTEWTSEGAIRHPSFKGLREDKPVEELVREVEEEEMPGDAAGTAERSEGVGAGASGTATRKAAARPATRGPAERDAKAGRPGGSVEIGGVVITSRDRVLYPEAGVTKEDVARYWDAVANAALPLLVDRPLTLYRCPRGIDGDCFFQKHANETVPETIGRVHVPDGNGDPKPEPFMLLDGLPALLTLAQLGALELHVWNARADRLDRPDTVVMDVDPGPGVPWSGVVRAAVALRELLAELGLESWPRATGGKGLHVVVPLVRRSGWDEVSSFARALAELMAAGAPDLFVSRSAKSIRKGKIYVDWLRNVRGATAIGTFSPRARPGAPVAHPMTWETVEGSKKAPIVSLREATEIDWAARDPWRGFGATRQSITARVRKALGIG